MQTVLRSLVNLQRFWVVNFIGFGTLISDVPILHPLLEVDAESFNPTFIIPLFLQRIRYSMFSFFKPKPLLKELLPTHYIDIHSHILPGIDDGAKTLEHPTALLRRLQSVGFFK